VTGRPRRCGWLDLVALKYAVRVNGADYLAVTKIDVLTGLDTIKVCVGYDIDGTEVKTIPASSVACSKAIPIYEDGLNFLRLLVTLMRIHHYQIP